MLKEHWNNSDESLVKNGSFTETGYDTYWKSFDLAIEFNVRKREQFLAKEVKVASKRKLALDDQLLHSHQQGDDMKRFFK